MTQRASFTVTALLTLAVCLFTVAVVDHGALGLCCLVLGFGCVLTAAFRTLR